MLLPFGGAGGLHACAVARELGMTRILVPPSPGLLCAYGALTADVAHDFVASVMRPAGARLAPADVAAAFLPLVQAATRAFERQGGDAVDPAARRLERAATLRYRGQSFELTVPLRRADGAAVEDLVAAFHDAHRARYGYALDREVELATLRLRAVGKVAPLPLPAEPRDAGPVEIGRARAVPRRQGARRATAVAPPLGAGRHHRRARDRRRVLLDDAAAAGRPRRRPAHRRAIDRARPLSGRAPRSRRLLLDKGMYAGGVSS